MKYDNGQEIPSFTAMDNKLFEKIYKMTELTDRQKDVLLSLCRQILYQDENNVIRTSWWGAVYVTADDVGCSPKTVQRAYKRFEELNIISKKPRLREKNIDGKEVPRKVNWITINTDTDTWRTKPCPGTEL